ncbi:Uma2 family endonuclease [Haloferula sargassicola]|uniref:Uma2 family endonuclease n=1 Tax=Haloferula sargassicola TaxID=490096 RepID=UPI0033658743
MIALPKAVAISVDDYLHGEEIAETKHEYIGGEVHAMAGGTRDHSAIAANAIGSLFGLLRGKPCRPFTSDLKVRIDFPDMSAFTIPMCR